MVIILALCIPITASVVGFLVLKAVQLGLRWQIQTAKQEQPTLEVKKPVKEFVEKKKVERETEEQVNILQEWIHGPQESR